MAMDGSAQSVKSVFLAFLLLSSIKWLLVPTYRSTDFDVHRNWLAITHHLPLAEWYFDDVNGTTVHTLDYPPLFAFFEAALSNNAVTTSLLNNGWLDERCLELLPDSIDDDGGPITATSTSDRCVRFQRATVILSDAVLFAGAYLATQSMSTVGEEGCGRAPWLTFTLIVTNPGLIMLDHVHFQYNGMLLGMLLISIAFMVRGASPSSSPSSSQRIDNQLLIKSHLNGRRWELVGAATFAALLAMKHLYLTLAPLYFFYLLRRHCFVAERSSNGVIAARFSWDRLLVLAALTLILFLSPFIPFVMQSDPVGQMQQILKRLFPFGRGLVHDYWAANVWALYLFASRVATFIFRKAPIPGDIRGLLESFIPFPEPKPSLVALLLLVGLWPGGIDMAWKVGRWSLVKPLCNPGKFFIHAVVFCSLSAFMLGYHVHEKAIMTAVIPLTLLATNSRHTARLYIRTCMFGLFGLLPLLFRPEELLLKVGLYVTWMCGAIYGLERVHYDRHGGGRTVLTKMDFVAFATLAVVLIFMEIIHPIVFMPSGRMEFLPLMTTSMLCAIGLVGCWTESWKHMFYGSVKTAWR
mmetsp:Transcript_1908/g.3438  ORF Transcript_1908/g.3438 Transcript_1908/m.3438 type:complete len:580 (-) Transcript_1908:917-2656(-)